MPQNNPTQHTSESLSVYLSTLESLVTRLQHCRRMIDDNKLGSIETMHDDSFHVGARKVQAFIAATEKATTNKLLAKPERPTVQESLTKSDKALKSAQSKAKKKARPKD